MKIKTSIMLSLIFLLSLGFSSCRRDIVLPDQYSYVNFETECLGTNMDGTMRLRAWGSGPTRAAAIENAKRNAIRDVIFKGIKKGSGEFNRNPLTYEVNAQERYEDYFNAFFADGGAYTLYSSLADETLTSRSKAKSKVQQSYGVVVTVNRAALQQRLIDDNVIKPKH